MAALGSTAIPSERWMKSNLINNKNGQHLVHLHIWVQTPLQFQYQHSNTVAIPIPTFKHCSNTNTKTNTKINIQPGGLTSTSPSPSTPTPTSISTSTPTSTSTSRARSPGPGELLPAQGASQSWDTVALFGRDSEDCERNAAENKLNQIKIKSLFHDLIETQSIVNVTQLMIN